MYSINKKYYLVPWDVFNLINDYQMISKAEMKEIYDDVVVEIKLFNYLKNLKLDRNQIRNQIRVLSFIKDKLMNDLYIVYDSDSE